MGLPVPGIPAHVFQIEFCLPAEEFGALVGAGIDGGQVSGTAGRDLIGNGDAVDTLKGLDHVEHAVAGAGAEVEDVFSPVILVKIWPLFKASPVV